MERPHDSSSAGLRIGLVGAGKGGTALLDLLLDWPHGHVTVVVDPRPDAPGRQRAERLGLATATHHADVFAYPVDLVLEATGQPTVLDDLLRARPAHVDVIGAGGLRFLWDLLEAKVKPTRQLQAQLDIALALGSTLDLQAQTAIVTRRLAQACGVDRCSLFFWDKTSGLVTPVMSQFATGEDHEAPGAAFRGLGRLTLAEVPYLAALMEQREPIEIDDPGSSPLMPPGWTDRFGFKSVLVVPVLRKGEVIGACVLDYCQERRRFSSDQAALALTLGGQVSLAFENARLYEETERGRWEAELLAAVARTINEVLDLKTVLERITEAAKELCGSDMARIALREPGSDTLTVCHRVGARYQAYETVRLELGKGVSGEVLATGRPFRTDHYAEDPRITKDYVAIAQREAVVAELAVPIQIDTRVEGVLLVDNRSARPFTDRDQAMLGRLGDHAAIAIRNARLFAEAEQRRQEAQSLAEIGRHLLESLDPTAVA